MTTVIYDVKKGLVGCDTGATTSDLSTSSGGISKMTLIPACGVLGTKLYVASGELTAIHHIIAMVRSVYLNGGNPALMYDETPRDINANILEFSLDDNTPVKLYADSYTPMDLTEKDVFTMGSGTHLAMGAWAAGGDIINVLDICKQYDPYSSGGSLVFDLNKRELIHGTEFVGNTLNYTKSKSKKGNTTRRTGKTKKRNKAGQ